MTEPRTYIGITEAAKHLGVSTRTIRRYIDDGRLTGYRLAGKLVRVDVDELEALIQPIAPSEAPGIFLAQ